MKRKLFFLASFVVVIAFSFSSCFEIETTDDCSNELGDIGPDYNCSVSVLPEICTLDGVDDHWLLNGVEYPCPDGDCTQIPEEMVLAILAMEDCGTKKSLDLDAINLKISVQATEILEKLRAEAVLCKDLGAI